MNALGSAFSQKVLDDLRAMNGRSIPDDQQFTGDLASEQLQKANHIGSFVRMILRLHEDPAFWSNAAHRRKVITSQLDVEHRRLAHGSIGMHSHRQEVKGGLIYKDDRSFFLLGLFFSAGHRSSFQVWIAASSRWVAFSMGFCRLCLMRRRRREPWAR